MSTQKKNSLKICIVDSQEDEPSWDASSIKESSPSSKNTKGKTKQTKNINKKKIKRGPLKQNCNDYIQSALESVEKLRK